MKKALLPLLLVGLAAMGAANVNPGITVETVSPQPAEPGDTVKLHITVSNEGDDRASFRPVSVETVEESA